jgi:Putative MetA-pathway of phenol degradation
MIRRAAIPVLAIILAMAGPVRAQEPPQETRPQETIEPDRPDVTNGTHVVDIGLMQIEIGGLYTHASADQRAWGSPFTARVGLLEWLEARIGTDGFLSQSDPFGRVTGLGNLQLGAKLRLWAKPGGIPVLSILPTVNLPTASVEKGLSSGDTDFTLAVLTGTDIGRHGHVDINYGIGAIGAGGGAPHFAQHLVSVSASVAASDNWNPYVETFWISRQESGGGAIAAFDLGTIYELGSRFAIDGGIQIGVSGSAPDLAAFGGFSIIVGDVLGKHGVHARQRHAQERPSTRR